MRTAPAALGPPRAGGVWRCSALWEAQPAAIPLRPHPLTGPTPITLLPLRPRGPAVPTVARDLVRTPSLASARVPPQPSRRLRRLAIPATVPVILVARSYLPRLSRWDREIKEMLQISLESRCCGERKKAEGSGCERLPVMD